MRVLRSRVSISTSWRLIRTMATNTAQSTKRNGIQGVRLAVLHQAIEPPIIGGVRKAKKPGGYKDSSADIAYVLGSHNQTNPSSHQKIEVITPETNPPPDVDENWSFPDTEVGILDAINTHGATHIWANTILFSNHPLQMSDELTQLADRIYMVGQPPHLVEKYDDKNWVNSALRKDKQTRFKLPRSWIVNLDELPSNKNLKEYLSSLDLPFPMIGKPIRGRGSHGVKLCPNLDSLTTHLDQILSESPQVMLEEFLAGQEGTVTVFPPNPNSPDSRYWALPIVERFNHADGVAPYNGAVAITQNSRVVPLDIQGYRPVNQDGMVDFSVSEDRSNAYVDIRWQCEAVAELLGCTAPIRVDVRRKREGDGTTEENPFVMFDVNMKPNMTGPGRPGRENQASLTAMAAEALGWDYARLLREMIGTATSLAGVRTVTLSKEFDRIGWSDLT